MKSEVPSAPASLRIPSLAAAVLLGAMGSTGWAQDDAEPAPDLDAAVSVANTQLSQHPSPWRPCQSAAQLSLDDDGYLEITTERSAYCADSRQRVHIGDLDAALVSVEVDVEGAVVLGCRSGQDCVRNFRRRKIRAEDGGWERKDDRWIPDGPETMPHLASEARIELFSDRRVADQVATAVRYLARSAASAPDAFTPEDPFSGRVAALSTSESE